MVRVLHVFGHLNMGGAETLIMNIYRRIDKTQIQFDFIVHGKAIGKYEEEIKKLGGAIYRAPEYKVINHFRYKKWWYNFFRQHNEYKVIHGHVRSTAAIYLKIAHKEGLKTISHSHSTSNGVGIKSMLKKILQLRIPKWSDYMLACSRESACWLFGKYSKSDRCIILNNGIIAENFIFDSKKRIEIRNKFNIMDDEILIGNIGRFVDVKNHMFIVEIAEKMIHINNRFKFMLCGDGEKKEKIINEVKKRKIENNFIFISSCNDIYKYYNAFDLFILPSKYEGLGMVLIEAQYNGLLCVASDAIPKEAIISNKLKLIELDSKKWIKELIEDSKSLDRNIIMNKNSYKYNIDNQIEMLKKLY